MYLALFQHLCNPICSNKDLIRILFSDSVNSDPVNLFFKLFTQSVKGGGSNNIMFTKL